MISPVSIYPTRFPLDHAADRQEAILLASRISLFTTDYLTRFNHPALLIPGGNYRLGDRMLVNQGAPATAERWSFTPDTDPATLVIGQPMPVAAIYTTKGDFTVSIAGIRYQFSTGKAKNSLYVYQTLDGLFFDYQPPMVKQGNLAQLEHQLLLKLHATPGQTILLRDLLSVLSFTESRVWEALNKLHLKGFVQFRMEPKGATIALQNHASSPGS